MPRLVGWRVVGPLPLCETFPEIGAPHTSNWDLPLGLAAAAAFGVRISWLGKDALYRCPVGGLMRWLGGIPIHRDKREGVVEQAAETLASLGWLVLVITPEGTRSGTSYWRSGFYHIATATKVPIFPVYFDRSTRQVGAGPSIYLTGDVERDMNVLRDFYAERRGLRPEDAGEARLREEG